MVTIEQVNSAESVQGESLRLGRWQKRSTQPVGAGGEEFEETEVAELLELLADFVGDVGESGFTLRFKNSVAFRTGLERDLFRSSSGLQAADSVVLAGWKCLQGICES